MPQCQINGVSVKVEEGSTIIQAYRQLEKDIAHYCWHPGLSVAGVCRLCMVEIKGNPKLQIACNTLVTDGMEITNQSEKVKETVRWGLEFHLINHPLDCPICDQAGECVLQEQYMRFGQYSPLMSENKVKKKKVLDLGSKIVLDTERCILCTRCTRFTSEVSKTHELGIFNRNDKSEIGTFKNKPLENDYALNTVDICPVGALTSKKFRFQQRVWYLKEAPSICTGCSTGCNTTVNYNEENVWRLLPRYNKEINGHWMCDQGRETIRHTHQKNRTRKAFKIISKEKTLMKTLEALKDLKQEMNKIKSVALVLTGGYTIEEYNHFLRFFKRKWNSLQIYHLKNNPKTFDSFDGFLIRGDKNPNTYGLIETMKNQNLTFDHFQNLRQNIENKKVDLVVVCGPQNISVFPEIDSIIKNLIKAPSLLWIAPFGPESLCETQNQLWMIPAKTYLEKEGTFINYKGIQQKIKPIGLIVEQAMSLEQVVSYLEDDSIQFPKPIKKLKSDMKENQFLNQKGVL